MCKTFSFSHQGSRDGDVSWLIKSLAYLNKLDDLPWNLVQWFMVSRWLILMTLEICDFSNWPSESFLLEINSHLLDGLAETLTQAFKVPSGWTRWSRLYPSCHYHNRDVFVWHYSTTIGCKFNLIRTSMLTSGWIIMTLISALSLKLYHQAWISMLLNSLDHLDLSLQPCLSYHSLKEMSEWRWHIYFQFVIKPVLSWIMRLRVHAVWLPLTVKNGPYRVSPNVSSDFSHACPRE